MNNNFNVAFLKEANKSKVVKLSSLYSTDEYSPGKLLDFINLLIGNGVATLKKDRLIITSDEEKYKNFKREHISFVRSFSKSDILTHSIRIDEVALRALVFVYKNPACTNADISKEIGSVDLSTLGVLNRLQLVVSVDNEFFCTLTASDYNDLIKELKRRGINVPTDDGEVKERKTNFKIEFANLTLSGGADLKLTPASLIFYFYQNCTDLQIQRDMRRKGLHLMKYPTVIDEMQSYFRFAIGGKEYSFDFNLPILEQLEKLGYDKIGEKDVLLFKVLVKLKSIE